MIRKVFPLLLRRILRQKVALLMGASQLDFLVLTFPVILYLSFLAIQEFPITSC